MFYTLCAYDRQAKYDNAFWEQDIKELFLRIELLVKYNCVPYIMRYKEYKNSPYMGIYILIARWCNQLPMFYKHSLEEFVEIDKGGSTKKYFSCLISEFPWSRKYTKNIVFQGW